MTTIAKLHFPIWIRYYLTQLLVIGLLASCSQQPRHYDVDREQYPVKGVDLSAHNGDVDFARMASDTVSFVMLKATEGTEFCDAMFSRNYQKAVDAGLKVGAYHFFRFDAPGHIQAYHFLGTIAERPMDLPLAIDVEEWTNAKMPDIEVIEQLQQMVNVLEAAGYRVVIYTNKQGYERYVEPTLYGHPLWICSLGSEPQQYGWRLWQHSHKGRVKGVYGDVDINTFNGSLQEFNRWISEGLTQ